MYQPPISSLLNLFSQRAASAIRKLPDGSWRFVSKFHYVTDEEILAVISEKSGSLRALTLDQKTSFLAIEIGPTSRYNNPTTLQDLLLALRSSSLEPRIYRASGSSSIHIYLMLTERVNISDAALGLNQLLSASLPDFSTADIEIIGPEGLLSIPLQTGFAWLTDKLAVKASRDELTFDSAITLFMSDLQKAASSPDQLLSCVSAQAHAVSPVGLSWGSEEEASASTQLPSDLIVSPVELKEERLSVLELQCLFDSPEPKNDETPSTKELEDITAELDIAKSKEGLVANVQPAPLLDSINVDRDHSSLECPTPSTDSLAGDFPTEISHCEKSGSESPNEYIECDQGKQLLLFPIIPANSGPVALGDYKPNHKSRGRPPNEGTEAV